MEVFMAPDESLVGEQEFLHVQARPPAWRDRERLVPQAVVRVSGWDTAALVLRVTFLTA